MGAALAPRSGHSGIPPRPPRLPESCWLPARSRRSAAPGAERGRSRAARSALAVRSEQRGGGSAGEAEGPAAGWGQRSHWHAAPAPPPRRAGSAGAQRAPPSVPSSRRRGFPVTCPALGGGTRGHRPGAARSPWQLRRSRDAAAPTAAGVPLLPERQRLHLFPSASAEPPAAPPSVRVPRGEPRLQRDPERRDGSDIPLLCRAGSKLQGLPVPAATA